MWNSLSKPWVAIVSTFVLLAVLISWLVLPHQARQARMLTGPPLILYCAAGIKAPVEALVSEYEQLTGIPVQVQYGGSQTLLAAFEVARRGDLYLPADDSYVELARSKKLLAETLPLARMKLVLAVKKGNPKHIQSLDDILRPEVRLVQGDPEATAVGYVTRKTLQSLGQWEAVQARTAVYKLTVNDVLNDLKIGAVDVGFAWDALVQQYPEVEMIQLPALTNAAAMISIGVLGFSAQPAKALSFARFLNSPEYGAKEFARHHYDPLPGDEWTMTPELVFYSGAVNRVAVEESLNAFERREGIRINRIYNGCGILVGQMKAGGRPDVYLTCDASFVPPVADLFCEPAIPMSKTDILILVPKGNPHAIKSLADLGKASLKVGVANPEQSTLGALTRRLLEQGGILDQVMRNVVTQTPTADLLVNQLRAGSLDAVVVYQANTKSLGEQFERIPLPIPGAVATQTFSVGLNSKYKHLGERLRERLRSAEGRARYETAGFQLPSGDLK